MKKSPIIYIWYIFLAFVGATLIADYWVQSHDIRQVPYSEFQTLLETGAISEIVLSNDEIIAELKNPKGQTPFLRTNRIEPALAERLQKYGVKYSMKVKNVFLWDAFSWLLMIFVMFAVWSFFARRFTGGLQNGMMSVGKSKAKIYVVTDTKVTFDDVAGVDEAKAELKEIVDFLKDRQRFERLGGRIPKGVLLVGPPGTGKTLIAKAIAGEASVPFFSTNGAEFVEMFVGVGAARVRDLFEQAKSKAPCIIFIDELDALGKVRMVSGSQGNDEKEQTLNQLLAELDGFDTMTGIILLAATNRPEILDPALLRSGRFDKQVVIDHPDKQGRGEILKLHSKKTKLAAHVDLEKVAALTPGFTGADLANLVNEATLVAARRNAEAVTDQDFTDAVERMLTGLEKRNRLINPFERTVVAHHEMGHAIVASILSVEQAIHKISIIPRGIGTLGYTLQRPTEDRFLMTKQELEKKISVLLAGRAAELLIFQHLSTGAADDLDKATDIAWAAVTRYGMAETLRDVVYEKSTHSYLGDLAASAPIRRNYAEATALQIDFEVRELIRKAFARATNILTQNEALVRKAAKILIEKETLNESELKELFAEITEPTAQPFTERTPDAQAGRDEMTQ